MVWRESGPALATSHKKEAKVPPMAGRMVKDHGRKWERETNAHLCGWEAANDSCTFRKPSPGVEAGMGN